MIHLYAYMTLHMYGDIFVWRPGIRLGWVGYQCYWLETLGEI